LQPPLPIQEHLDPQFQERLELAPPPPPQEEFDSIVSVCEQYEEPKPQQEKLEIQPQEPIDEPPVKQVEEQQQQEQELVSESAES
jgi:hypothetical protein